MMIQTERGTPIRTEAPAAVRTPIDWTAQDWTSVVRAGEAMARAHRATGLRTAAKRRETAPAHRIPLAARVDADTFLDGAHSALVRTLEASGARFGATATDEQRRAFIGGGLCHQTAVDANAARAHGEAGAYSARVDVDEAAAVAAHDAAADAEALEEAGAVLAALPERYRRALADFQAHGWPSTGAGERALVAAREAALAVLAARGHAVDAETLRGRRAARIRMR